MKIYYTILGLLLGYSTCLWAQEVVEEGNATVWKDAPGDFVAAHASAPLGTIVAVRNFVNGQIAYVEITKKLNAQTDKKNIIALSNGVYEKLALNLFRSYVELRYNPANTAEQFRITHREPLYYKVVGRESLYSIANMYQVKLSQLMLWNNLKDEVLYPGQILNIYSPSYVKEPSNLPPFTYRPTAPLVRDRFVEETVRTKMLDNLQIAEAAHPTAPLGTNLIIINPKDGKSMLARVVQALDKRYMQSGYTLGLSSASLQRLGILQSPLSKLKCKYQPITLPSPRVKQAKKAFQNTYAQYLPDSVLYYEGNIVFHKTLPLGAVVEVKSNVNNRSLELVVVGRLSKAVKNPQVTMQLSRTAMYYLNGEKEEDIFSLRSRPLAKATTFIDQKAMIQQIANRFEEGLARPYEDKGVDNRLVALHKVAPIGTWMVLEMPKTLPSSNRNRPFRANNNSFANFNADPFVGLSQPTTQNNTTGSLRSSSPGTTQGSVFNDAVFYPVVYNPWGVSLLVEVVGRLPANEANKDIDLKISRKAFELFKTQETEIPLSIYYYQYHPNK